MPDNHTMYAIIIRKIVNYHSIKLNNRRTDAYNFTFDKNNSRIIHSAKFENKSGTINGTYNGLIDMFVRRFGGKPKMPIKTHSAVGETRNQAKNEKEPSYVQFLKINLSHSWVIDTHLGRITSATPTSRSGFVFYRFSFRIFELIDRKMRRP